MGKTKYFFLLGALLITALAFIILRRFFLLESGKSRQAETMTSTFMVTTVSKSGGIYLDAAESRPWDPKILSYTRQTQVKADKQTSFEFIFAGAVFIALPNSRIAYDPHAATLLLAAGEFYWTREIRTKDVWVNIGDASRSLRLSDAGRLRLKGNEWEIWDYAGTAQITRERQTFQLQSQQYISSAGKETPQVSRIPARPIPTTPLSFTLSLNRPQDSLLEFRWQPQANVYSYVIRFYPSPLRENLLSSRIITDNQAHIDILSIQEGGTFFWEVVPLDTGKNLEGAPSAMGQIEIRGGLLLSDTKPQPPNLDIQTLSVSGNMVLIKGMCDPTAQLTINDDLVKTDTDGRFIHTISYASGGKKEIVFRLLSSRGVETVLKRQVIIFEE